MLTKVMSAAIYGLDGVLIEVEVDVANRGFPTFTIVGLPDKAIGESKDRVRTAIINAGYEMPDSRITVNMAPADIPKVGSSFDLPIALGILASCGLVEMKHFTNSIFVGELSLEGGIRPVPGVISIALLGRQKNITNLYVPAKNCQEASFIGEVKVYPIHTLGDLVKHLNGYTLIEPGISEPLYKIADLDTVEVDFSDIAGQFFAKRALEIAAAGMHNLHMKGPPGVGKTMLSRAFPSILPPMNFDEIIEVSRIYSAVGMLGGKSFIFRRPFRAPHHTTSRNGLIGGGSHPTPGEVSLAHRGALFLDEFPEFTRSALESLRQPLEDGVITISRVSGTITFPSRFLLLAASNPCPCGYLGHPTKSCHCMPGAILSYKKKLSGPLLDRIDLHAEVTQVDEEKLSKKAECDTTSEIRDRVVRASEMQKKRYESLEISANSQLSSAQVRTYCRLDDNASQLLGQAVAKYSLSARAYFKVIKVSQTISDLCGDGSIRKKYVAEALNYRYREE